MASFPAVRMTFTGAEALVEDAPPGAPAAPTTEERVLSELEDDEEPREPNPNPDTLERAAGFNPDLVVSGALPDIVAITASPLVGGLPSLRHKRGRSALASVAAGRVRFSGSPRLVRRLLKLLQI